MTSTDRLYYTDAYLSEFTARVVAREDEGRKVYLDRTAFYPTSGGQPHDVGRLNDSRVVDTIDEGERIAHIVDHPLGDDSVSGVVDWTRRHDFMQQHTGQHLLSAVFADGFGYQTVAVHFGPDYSTVDLDTPVVSLDAVRRAEEAANALIVANHTVRVEFEDAASVTGLRKASARDGTLRVVTIEGVDRSACGGTHVRSTGEIGSVLLRSQEKMKQCARIEFVCGLRAMRRARADYEALAAIGRTMNSALGDLPALVAAQANEVRQAASAAKRLEEELAAFRARERHAAADPTRSGQRWSTERLVSGTTEMLRPLAIAYAALPKAVFLGVCEEPRAVLLAAAPDTGIDAGAWLKARLIALGGRGGGSPRLAQGTVPTPSALDQLLGAVDDLRASS